MVELHAAARMPALPAGAFRRMGWAFLFLGITVGPSVRLGQENFLIDVLPDFIGYLMIATAANQLVRFHRRATAIRNLALFLTYLSIPTVVQYTVVTSQAGNLTTWKAPLWPLTVVLGLLELVLVWMLCGLVADLARRARDEVTERRARGRRVLYVFLKVLVAGGSALILVSPKPELILGGAIASVAIGLTLMALMMGLMGRAARLCEEWSAVALPSDADGAVGHPGGWVYHLLALGGYLVPLALAVGAVYYYQHWQEARHDEMRKASSSEYFSPAREAFYGHLRAGRIDEAYASTTADFKKRISREQFGERARRCADYLKVRERGTHGGGSGSTLSSDYLQEWHYVEVEKGRVLQVTLTIRRDGDTVLRLTPPPVKVDDFNVEEKAEPGRMGLPFGQR